MSSFYSDASLVLVPSGYKTSKVYSAKPTDGTGDLTFTRSNDTATRVASNGLIERVRTNLILQSEAFNVTWVPVRSSVTANTTTAPNGTSTAYTLFDNTDANLHYVQQTFTAITGPATISVYAKANQLSQIQIVAQGGTTAMGRGFDLSTGTTFLESVGGVVSNDLGQSITDVGDGWYRCTMSWTSTGQTSFWILTSYLNAATYVGTGTDGVFIWGAMLETTDFGATPYIPTTTAAVSVGMLANVPRLDYLGGGCPKLLLEPQRTNLFNYSEQLNNAYWSAIGSLTITANTNVSPDGYTNADRVTTTAVPARIQRAFTGLTAGTRTLSCFVKAGTGSTFRINAFDGIVDRGATFNVATGTVTSTGTGVTATITNYGNGWYRTTHNYTSAGTSYSCQFFFDDVGTYQVYGFQFEDLASYATSYIPTLGAAVTRGADAARTASGVTSIFNSTWTAFGELVIPARGSAGVATGFGLKSVYGSDNVANWVLGVAHSLSTTSAVDFVFYVSGGTVKTVTQAITYGTPFKFAVTSDGVVYVNGVQVSASSSLTPATPVEFGFGRLGQTDFSNGEAERVAQALLFKSILPPADLAALTA